MTATNEFIVVGNENPEVLDGGTNVQFISGSGGNDTIIGAINGVAPGSTLSGDNGNDSISSSGVGDIVLGGAGNDFIANESGQATLTGGAGNDTIDAEDSNTTIFGGAGNDSILLRDEGNLAAGDDGDDTIVGLDGGDIFAGGAGRDYIQGEVDSNAATQLFGNEDEDTLCLGDNSSDSAYGGRGDDSIHAGTGATADNQLLAGERGGDQIDYLGSGKNVILSGDNLFSGASAGTDAGADSFNVGVGLAIGLSVFGGAGDDSITGTLGASSAVYMGQGNDFFNVASSGSCLVSGDLGDDAGNIVLGGNDSVYGDGASQASDATLGNDSFVLTGAGGNVIYGDAGDSGSLGGNDTIDVTGLGSGNIIYGAGGNDSLMSGGNNTLIGGAGNDVYIVGGGDFIPFDSLGVNTYVAGTTGVSSDTITVQPGDSFTGGATFLVTGEDELIKTISQGGVIASDERDVITITGTADGVTSLKGGDDTFSGNNLTAAGVVDGGAGNDNIEFTGTDIQEGTVSGGAGNDLIVFTDATATVNAIVDGSAGNDTLEVEGIFAGSANSGAGNDVFEIDTIAAGAFIDAGAGDEEIIIGVLGSGDAIPTVIGGAGADTISIGTSSSAGPVFIDGDVGDDVLRVGSAGNATLVGGDGNDVLVSGAGIPISAGSTPVYKGDSLVGGLGNDTFAFTSLNELGFIGDAPVGTDQFSAGYSADIAYIGTAAGKTGTNDGETGLLNNVYVDTISGWNTGDKLFFDTDAFGTASPAGTTVFSIPGGLGAAGVNGTDVDGANSPAFLGAIGSTTGDFGTDFGANVGDIFFDAPNSGSGGVFVYDETAGALYYGGSGETLNLVAVFDGVKPTSLSASDFIFAASLSPTSSDVTTI